MLYKNRKMKFYDFLFYKFLQRGNYQLMNKRLIFIRHGRSEGGIDYEDMSYTEFKKRLLKEVDPNLNPTFFDGYRFEKLGKIDIIFTSDSNRAKKTAEIFHENLPGNPPLDCSFEEKLKEIEFNNKSISEREFNYVGKKYNENHRRLFLKKWYDISKDNGIESYTSSIKRVSNLKNEILNLDDNYQNILIVTHGWFLRLNYLYYNNYLSIENNGTIDRLLNAPLMKYGEFFELKPGNEIKIYKQEELFVNVPPKSFLT